MRLHYEKLLIFVMWYVVCSHSTMANAGAVCIKYCIGCRRWLKCSWWRRSSIYTFRTPESWMQTALIARVWVIKRNAGTFVPKNFRSRERKGGTFAHGSESSMELSFPGIFVPFLLIDLTIVNRLLLCPRKLGAVFHQMTMPPFFRGRYFRETTMPPKLGAVFHEVTLAPSLQLNTLAVALPHGNCTMEYTKPVG